MAHPDNPHAGATAKEREGASFPLKHLLRTGLIQGRVLDFGCGFGADVRALERRGVDVTGYDPHHAPTLPEGRFDTVLCFYVLNVLLPEEQDEALMDLSERLAPGGVAYIAVRRDVGRGGFRMHRLHGVQTYQRTVTLPHESVLRNDFCEIYAVRPLANLEGVRGCPFCRAASSRTVLAESLTSYAILDGYPAAPGHALVIPKRHAPSLFDLPPDEQAAVWAMAARVRRTLAASYAADGFTVGVNDGRAAGQTVMHGHLHVIPRTVGDVPNPRGGIRHVISGRGDYRAER